MDHGKDFDNVRRRFSILTNGRIQLEFVGFVMETMHRALRWIVVKLDKERPNRQDIQGTLEVTEVEHIRTYLALYLETVITAYGIVLALFCC